MNPRFPTGRTRARLAALTVAAATIASLPAGAVASSDHTAAMPAGVKICGTFKGPHWSYRGASSSQYIVYSRRGGACTLAMQWAPKLVSKRSQSADYLITGGPTGWICANSAVHFGICTQAINGHPTAASKAFAWAGDTRK
jgi:hypothetical protein